MKPKQSSMKVPDDFKSFIKRAVINHGYARKATDTITQVEMQLRIVRYFKFNDIRYAEFINMEDQNA